MNVVALDIGGSSVKYARITRGANDELRAKEVYTHRLGSSSFDELRSAVLGICERMAAEGVDAVGISTTGSVDANGLVLNAGHFTGYSNVSWRDILSEEAGITEVTTVNDGKASAWAEYSSSGANNDVHVHLVVGTGIGGGVIVGGELLYGDGGQAGRIGHIKVTAEQTPVCSCGKTGCAESLSSAKGMVALYRNLAGGHAFPDEAGFSDLVDRYDDDRQGVSDVLELGGFWLGVAIGNAMNVLNPGLVTLGGGVVVATGNLVRDYNLASNPYVSGINRGVMQSAHPRIYACGNVRVGRLGNDAGLIGAADLACRSCGL